MLDILGQCFKVDPAERIDASSIINHDFFKVENEKYKYLNTKKVSEAFMSCRHFKPRFFFQKEVIRHMASRFILQKEKEFLRKIFDALDDEKDGELTAEEFCDQFKEKFKLELPVSHMQKIIKCIDDGGDGLIQFTEFVLASCSKKNLLSEAHIITEFTYLDMDKDGMIGIDDMRKFLLSYSDKVLESGEMLKMLQEIACIYSNDKNKMVIKKKASATEVDNLESGAKYITMEVFKGLLNEVNDSIRH